MSPATDRAGWNLSAWDNRLVLASGNRGKLVELEALLVPVGITIISTAETGLDLDVVEDGETFEANARKKADSWALASGLPCLADDSGLVVDALDGRPGVHSARYAGPGANDADRVARLLDELTGVPADRRSARFRCAAVLARPGHPSLVFHGTLEGQIGTEPYGHNGFGYDPVFLLDAEGPSLAEVGSAEKNRISHRGRALAALLAAYSAD